jgi:starvation-inducible DNA-binding protein
LESTNLNYLGLENDQLKSVAVRLNDLLANYQVYYQNLRNFHWNVEGENFFDLHNKFEELYSDARERIDEIAERILILRHQPLSKMSDYLAEAEIEESDILDSDREMVMIILKNHKILIRSMRGVIEAADKANDEGTIDLIGGFLENIEKMSWMLDAWSVRRMKSVLS